MKSGIPKTDSLPIFNNNKIESSELLHITEGLVMTIAPVF